MSRPRLPGTADGTRAGQTVAVIDDVVPIVMCGDPVLRRPAAPVDPADLASPVMRRLITQMRATMEAAPGVGLAAPQIGVPIQVVVVQDGPDRWVG